MSVKATWLGHAAWKIETSGTTILVDPFLEASPDGQQLAETIDADVILLTHGHEDHLGSAIPIAKRTGAAIAANYEICKWLDRQGVPKTIPMNLGGEIFEEWGRAKMTFAIHSSSLPDGSYGGCPGGFLLRFDKATIYHAGDTGLFAGMQLLARAKVDYALLPIGDNFTMGPRDAIEAIRLIQPRFAVPMHFSTWPPISQDPEGWSHQVLAETNTYPHILKVGESFELARNPNGEESNGGAPSGRGS